MKYDFSDSEFFHYLCKNFFTEHKFMKIQELVSYLDNLIPAGLQEDYDNAGFLLGNVQDEISGVLISIDLTPEVVEEAVKKHCNLIVTHHPFIFSGIKRITPSNTSGKMIFRLIEQHISVYSAHTNLDNLCCGVNHMLARHLGLENCMILSPMNNMLKKIEIYCPESHCEQLKAELFAAGAGRLGKYEKCAYTQTVEEEFNACEGATPFIGKIGEKHQGKENRISLIYLSIYEDKILEALKKAHPYEEPAYSLIPLDNPVKHFGAGMIGELPEALPVKDFLQQVKQSLGLPVIRHSALCRDKVRKIAICGGAGSFLIGKAKQYNADIFLTGDLKYHDFQKAENSLIIADIGHYESEQFAKDFFYDEISKKFSIFAVWISEEKSNFVNYI